MGVHIDEARHDQPVLRLDLFATVCGNRADFRDTAVRNCHVGFLHRSARPIDDGSPADNQIRLFAHIVLLQKLNGALA